MSSMNSLLLDDGAPQDDAQGNSHRETQIIRVQRIYSTAINDQGNNQSDGRSGVFKKLGTIADEGFDDEDEYEDDIDQIISSDDIGQQPRTKTGLKFKDMGQIQEEGEEFDESITNYLIEGS